MDSKWLFPIQLITNTYIEVVEDIWKAITRLKRPIDQSSWNDCLRRGVLKALTDENQDLLRRWWTEGWNETPPRTLPDICGHPTLRIQKTSLGEVLDTVYPNITSAAKEEGVREDYFKIMVFSAHNNLRRGRYFYRIIQEREDMRNPLEEYPWVVFAADNTVIGRYRTAAKMRAALGITKDHIEKAHNYNWNELKDGRWIWYKDWGFIPISPRDEVLGRDWLEKYGSHLSNLDTTSKNV